MAKLNFSFNRSLKTLYASKRKELQNLMTLIGVKYTWKKILLTYIHFDLWTFCQGENQSNQQKQRRSIGCYHPDWSLYITQKRTGEYFQTIVVSEDQRVRNPRRGGVFAINTDLNDRSKPKQKQLYLILKKENMISSIC